MYGIRGCFESTEVDEESEVVVPVLLEFLSGQ
jgi:hypothetical protein